MEIKKIIEMGEEKAGSLKELALIVGIAPNILTDVKAGRKHLPVIIASKLGDYLDLDKFDIVAAGEFAKAKDESARNYWRPFVETARAASFAIALLGLVTLIVTPAPVEAAPILKTGQQTLCIM